MSFRRSSFSSKDANSAIISNTPKSLVPIPPAYIRDARYQGDARVKLTSTIISLGAHSSSAPSYRSQGWTVSIHPEGKRYAYNTAQDGISIVTEAHVTDPGVAEQLEGGLAMLRALATEENVHIPASADLFLEIDQDTEACSYWFADHANRTVFWLHPVDTDTIGLPDTHSKRHLRESYTVSSSSGVLNYSEQSTPWRRTIGPMLKCSLPPHRNIPGLPWTNSLLFF
jgi:hypothetical protein